MSHTSMVFAACIAVIIGLAFRLMSLRSTVAWFGFLPQKWQRWFRD